MKARIHPTAIIENGAQLAEDVEVGAYAYIGPQTRIGAGTVIHHHATVDGNTQMGSNNAVYPYAFIGAKTQDLKFKGGNPGVIIGDNNCFREYVSVHEATEDNQFTIVGSDNNFLAYTHIAHDCVLGDHIIASNYCGIAGHVKMGSHIVLGGYAGIHQFCCIGDFAMVGAMSKVVLDVPPFVIVEGNPAKTRTINKVGLERNGFDADQMSQVKAAYRILFKSDLPRERAIEELRAINTPGTTRISQMLAFADKSERGIC